MGKIKNYYWDDIEHYGNDSYGYEYVDDEVNRLCHQREMSEHVDLSPKDWEDFLKPIDYTIEYKYNEDVLIKELREYVDSTYNQHYSQNKFQTTEFIIDNGHGEGFTLGNVVKYAQRYGKKEGYNRKDLMKVLHYALIALHVHDLKHGETNEN